MREFLERHTLVAIFIICFLEDVGVPMPLPSDVVVLYVGYRIYAGTINPFVVIPLILIAVNLAGSALYALARVGGRPMVDRYGHFLHLNADRLARAEAWLLHRGTLGIVIGRALPGVRLATVIACGLFEVPLRRFLPAQLAGVVLYVGVFLVIGYTVGPEAVESIHLPAISLRLVLLIVVAIVLPLALRQLNSRTATDDTRRIHDRLSSWQRVGADLFAGFVGAIELTVIWAIAASLTNLMGRTEVQRAALTLARWLDFDERPNAVAIAYTLDYAAVMAVCLISAVVFFQLLMPRFHIGQKALPLQAFALWLFMTALAVGVAVGRVLNHMTGRPNSETMWVSQSAGLVIGIVVLGLFGYAYVAVEARRLAIDRLSDDPEIAPSVVEAIEHPPVRRDA